MSELSDLKEFFESDEGVKPLVLRPEVLGTGERPFVLQGVNPRSILKSKEWLKIRRDTYKSTNYHCMACGFYASYDEKSNRFKSDKLNAHELYDVDYELKTMKLKEIIPLCEHCHAFIHQHGMNIRYDHGVNDEQFCWEVLEQGMRVLGHDIKHCDSTFEDEWNDWRFYFEGKEYGSKYKSFKDWQKKEEVMQIWWM